MKQTLGYKLRTGGGLPDKVFGMFGVRHDEDAEDAGADTLSADQSDAQEWAKKHNREAKLNGRRDFTFTAHIPETQEEADALYQQYLAMPSTRGAYLLYK